MLLSTRTIYVLFFYCYFSVCLFIHNSETSWSLLTILRSGEVKKDKLGGPCVKHRGYKMHLLCFMENLQSRINLRDFGINGEII